MLLFVLSDFLCGRTPIGTCLFATTASIHTSLQDGGLLVVMMYLSAAHSPPVQEKALHAMEQLCVSGVYASLSEAYVCCHSVSEQMHVSSSRARRVRGRGEEYAHTCSDMQRMQEQTEKPCES